MIERSYKQAFVFAIVLHVALVLSLLIKFTTSSRSLALSRSSVIINAVAISERNIDNQMYKPPVAPKQEEITKDTPVQPVVKQQPDVAAKKAQIKTTLQKYLLAEQAKEMAALKKEKQVYQKKMAKEQQQQMQKMLQNQVLAEQKQLAEEQSEAHGSQSQGEVDKYKAQVLQAISSQWIVPDGVDDKAVCQLLINVAPGGVVLDVQLLSSSGNSILDRSAQTAVLKASPLPVPTEPGLFDEFRTIKLRFNPQGVISN